jgi:putative ABC transport system substrate-binding protein
MLLHATNTLRIVLTLCALTFAGTGQTQTSAKTWRIGYIGTTPATTPESTRLSDAFLQQLQKHGYVEGKNLVVDRRYFEGKTERFPELAAEMVRLKVDVIVVTSSPGVRAAKEATTTIPIVMNGVHDPVGTGLVASLAHPGGNVTGIADLAVDLVPKRLDLLKAAVPGISRVAYLRGNFSGYDPSQTATLVNEQDAVARALGMTIVRVSLNSPQDLDAATTAVVRERPDALLISPSPTNFILRRELADFSIRQHLPAMASTREEAVAGALMSYGPSNAARFRRVADYIDKIFKGANPGDIPVEQPTAFELVVNLKTAKALGLSIPSSFLSRADEVLR